MMSSPVSGQLEISNDPDALAHRVAEWFTDTVHATPGTVRIALSGGSTPKELYTLLGGEPFVGCIPWQRVELFWGDERFVPHDDPASNYRMVQQALLSRAPIAADRIHPMPVEGAPADAAVRYETLLKRIYGADEFDSARPFFHIMFLGLGNDGHTASLIPGQPVLEERNRWVAAVTGGRAEIRITLTYPAIESSRAIAFLATGTEKAGAVAAVRAGDENLPAGRIRPSGDVIWFLDRAAASKTIRPSTSSG
jgi:6-phosphogluconolactonase